MADTNKLVFTCKKQDGTTYDMTYAHANPEADTADVKAVAQAIVANSSIFENKPIAVTEAKLVKTTESSYSLE